MKLTSQFPIKTDDLTQSYMKQHSEIIASIESKDVHTVKCSHEYKGKTYMMLVSKPKAFTLTVYLKEYMFYAMLTKQYALKEFFRHNGSPTQYERAKLCFMKIVHIERMTQMQEIPLFREGVCSQ